MRRINLQVNGSLIAVGCATVLGLSTPAATLAEETIKSSEPPLPNLELRQLQVVFRCAYD
jgi:hypothetical protein